MDAAIILRLLPTVILLVLLPKPSVQTHWLRRPHPLPPTSIPPLCESQYTLVNRACNMLPYTSVPPPAPPAPSGPPTPMGPDNLYTGYGQNETAEQEDCCRWLKEVDDVCVCELLVHLPPSLARPLHNYTVVVDESCSVTFQCGSRWVQF